MGRDKRNEQKREQFVSITRSMMQTPAWQALSTTAQALYPWLKMEWHGPKLNNNGKIQLSTRQAANCMGVTKTTAANAFHDLQAKGFITVINLACLGTDGKGKPTGYELTEQPLLGSQGAGRRLYAKWKKGQDFPVEKALTHNKTGVGGKKKFDAAKLANMPVGQPEKYGANLHHTSRQDAASMLNVSERSVNTAKKVERQGAPEQVEPFEVEQHTKSQPEDINEYDEVPFDIKIPFGVEVVEKEIRYLPEITDDTDLVNGSSSFGDTVLITKKTEWKMRNNLLTLYVESDWVYSEQIPNMKKLIDRAINIPPHKRRLH